MIGNAWRQLWLVKETMGRELLSLFGAARYKASMNPMLKKFIIFLALLAVLVLMVRHILPL